MLKVPADLSSLLRTGLFRSLVSLLIKVGTAGLTYAGFVVLARIMEETQYGHFASGLALATVLGVLGCLGQQVAVLRFWPEEMAKDRPGKAEQALRAGGALTLAASLVLGLATALAAMLAGWWFPQADGYGYLVATGVLILPMALAEYNSSALRAQGSVMTALLPRDIVWRLSLPLAALLIHSILGWSLGGAEAILLAAGLLLGALLLQFGWAALRHYRLVPQAKGTLQFWRERGTMSRWFLLGAAVDTIALNADTILVSLLVDPASAGLYFNAVRTAGLITLFSFATTLVVAPMIAQHFHGQDLRKAQAIAAAGCWAGFVFAGVTFVLFLLFGGSIMGLFGPGYESAYPLLILLSLGLLVDAAVGPTRTVMMMTGHERTYGRMFAAITVVVILVQLIALPLFGLVAAAAVNMAGRIVGQSVLAWLCYRQSGIDPTIFGIAKINRAAQVHAPVTSNFPR